MDLRPPGEEQLPTYAKGFMLPILCVVILTFMVVRRLHHSRWNVLPESATVLLIGALCGAGFSLVCWKTGKEFPISGWNEIDEATSLSMNFVLLPILIFQAGWTLNVRDFYAQLGSILLFAVGGTLIAAIVIFWVLKLMSGPIGMEWDKDELAAFASLISAVDPVATLTTFQSLGVEPFLNIIVLGEALINDAVALVLFEGFNGKADSEQESFTSLGLQMLWQLFGSSGLGVIAAHVMVAVFSASHLRHDKQMAALFVMLCPFVLYISAVAFNLSGIISTLFGGAFMGVYVKEILSDVEVQEYIESFLEVLAHLGDFVIFTMVGVGAALSVCGQWMQRRNYVLVLQLSVIVFVACLVGRAVAVFLLGAARNVIHRWRRLSWDREDVNEYLITPRRALVMWWGGGLRGAIALVCALDLRTKNMSLLVDVTMVNIYLTVIIFGGTTESLVRYLGIPLSAKGGEAGVNDGTPGGGTQESRGSMFSSQVPEYQQKALAKLHRGITRGLVGRPEDGQASAPRGASSPGVASIAEQEEAGGIELEPVAELEPAEERRKPLAADSRSRTMVF